MTMGLTPKQSALLGHIKAYAAEGLSPSFAELQRDMGLGSKEGVHRLLCGLEERGLIERMPNRARSIRILGEMELTGRTVADLRALLERINHELARRGA